MKLLFLSVIFILLGYKISSGTCIFLLMGKSEIIVAADSKVITPPSSKFLRDTIFTSACKIQTEGKFNFAAAGYFAAITLPILHNYCRVVNNIYDSNTVLIGFLSDYYYDQIMQMKNKDYKFFKDNFIKQKETPRAQILIWGFDNNKPYNRFIEFVFKNPINDSIVVMYRVVDSSKWIAIGWVDDIYKIDKPSLVKIFALGNTNAVKHFIEIEIKHHPEVVGYPIDILSTNSKGNYWIQKKENCQ